MIAYLLAAVACVVCPAMVVYLAIWSARYQREQRYLLSRLEKQATFAIFHSERLAQRVEELEKLLPLGGPYR